MSRFSVKTFISSWSNQLTIERYLRLLPLILLITLSRGYAQNDLLSWGPWHLTSLGGNFNFEGQYRSQKSVIQSRLRQHPKSTIFDGEFLLKTNSYIWHPNFMLLDVDLNLNPGARQDNFVTIPDRSEVRTSERIHVQSTFFNERPLGVNLFTNVSHMYVTREQATSVEMFRADLGGNLVYPNDTLPLNFSYLLANWNQKELQTGRKFLNRRHSLNAFFDKSFGDLDQHRLSLSFDDYTRQFAVTKRIRNQVSRIDLQNSIFFNESQTSRLNSMVWLYHQTGTIPFNRLQANENIRLKLPKNFEIAGNYLYTRFSQNSLLSNQHSINASLEHQIFLSLHSTAYLQVDNFSQSAFNETVHTLGLSFDYRKKIWNGLLSLSYEFRKRIEDRDNQSVTLRIFNEEHFLEDDRVVLLKNPSVSLSSVLVTDETETIIYERNIDYVLIERDAFLEIQRLPGGLIENGAKVFIDYLSDQELSHNFDSYNNRYAGSLSLFKHFLELYFRANEQDYDNVEGADFRVLKTISQRVYGARVSLGFSKGGVEIDNFDSNIIPYRSKRYFVTLGGDLFSRIKVSLTGSLRDFTLTAENENQKFVNLSGRILLNVGKRSTINLQSGYRVQEGRQIDLDFKTIRGEFSTRYRQFLITFGMEAYYRNYASEEINFNSAFLRFGREF